MIAGRYGWYVCSAGLVEIEAVEPGYAEAQPGSQVDQPYVDVVEYHRGSFYIYSATEKR